MVVRYLDARGQTLALVVHTLVPPRDRQCLIRVPQMSTILGALDELLPLVSECPRALHLLRLARRASFELALIHEVELRAVRQAAFEDALEHDAQLALLQRRGVVVSSTECLARVNQLLRDVTAASPLTCGLPSVLGNGVSEQMNALLEPVSVNQIRHPSASNNIDRADHVNPC